MHLQILATTINPLLNIADFAQQGLGQARPNKKLSQGAENFQELKICGHGTVLALCVFLKGSKELR